MNERGNKCHWRRVEGRFIIWNYLYIVFIKTSNIFSEFSRSILSSNSIEDSFDKLTEELDSVLNDTISVIEFNKCLLPDDECHIPAECVESINGKPCDCIDMGTGNGLSCHCSFQ